MSTETFDHAVKIICGAAVGIALGQLIGMVIVARWGDQLFRWILGRK